MSYGPADLQRDLAVSRETCERLETHRRLLELWSKRINLIGPNELEAYWRRHALDCGQLVGHSEGARRWIDIGSGAGFPGLVVACVLADREPVFPPPARGRQEGVGGADPNSADVQQDGERRRRPDLTDGASRPTTPSCLPLAGGGEVAAARVALVESNPKKTAFLREAIRETGAPAVVVDGSIDDVAPLSVSYDIVTARAFAPLPRIIKAAKPILDRGAMGLFLKGAEYRAEISAAADQGWTFQVEALASLSDPDGRILRIEGVSRASRIGSDSDG